MKERYFLQVSVEAMKPSFCSINHTKQLEHGALTLTTLLMLLLLLRALTAFIKAVKN